MLFVTTADGQVIALNARAFDAGIPPRAGSCGACRSQSAPNGGAQVFEVGSAAGGGEISLYGKFESTPADAATEKFNMLPKLPQSTITKAQQQGVEEWLVFTNRDDGRVFAHAAAGNGDGRGETALDARRDDGGRRG